MSVEEAKFIKDLDALWPFQTDDPTEGAGHLRLIKKTLQNQFPNLDAEVTLTPDEMNGLVDGIAACVLKVGDTMTGDLLMVNYKALTFAIAAPEDDDAPALFARVVGRDDTLYIEIIDSTDLENPEILNTLSVNPTTLVVTSEISAITPDGTDSTHVTTVENQRNILMVADVKLTGVSGGLSADATWRKRDLGTVLYNGITDALLDSNEITLKEGVYEVTGDAPAYKSDTHSCRLVDKSGPFTLLIGTNEKSNESDSTQTRSNIMGVITLATETVMYLETYTRYGAPDGLGVPTGIHGAGEMYSQLRFRKL